MFAYCLSVIAVDHSPSIKAYIFCGLTMHSFLAIVLIDEC